jgi:hypothetical protein
MARQRQPPGPDHCGLRHGLVHPGRCRPPADQRPTPIHAWALRPDTKARARRGSQRDDGHRCYRPAPSAIRPLWDGAPLAHPTRPGARSDTSSTAYRPPVARCRPARSLRSLAAPPPVGLRCPVAIGLPAPTLAPTPSPFTTRRLPTRSPLVLDHAVHLILSFGYQSCTSSDWTACSGIRGRLARNAQRGGGLGAR